MTCGEKIAILRRDNHLTQEQFAELMNVSRQAVSKWEMNVTFPDTEKLIKMSKLFSCSLDYLLKDEVESKDINQTQQSDHARRSFYIGSFLAYASCAPIIGFIAGGINIVNQKKTVNNRKIILISSIGIGVSLILTSIMAVGMALGL